MVEITSARCSICGAEFTGPDCVKKAEKHEKIPVETPEFKIGETIVAITPLKRIELIKIMHQSLDFEHRIVYNGYNLTDYKIFSLHADEDGIVHKTDILNSPEFKELRQGILEVGLKSLFSRIDKIDSISLE